MTSPTTNFDAAAAAAAAADTTWPEFVASLPRAMRRVVEQRDAIADEAYVCERTQSWSPHSIRSGWAPELRDVVRGVDALREAHDALADAEDADEAEEAREGLREALEALEAAIDAANDEAVRLAILSAEREAERGIEALLIDADRADDDAAWAEALEERLDAGGFGTCGWTVTREDDGALVVTGWASTRVVESDDLGDILIGRDPSGYLEDTRRGRVSFQIVDKAGDDAPNGLCDSIAEAVEAAEALASTHGVSDWTEAWAIQPRWIDV